MKNDNKSPSLAAAARKKERKRESAQQQYADKSIRRKKTVNLKRKDM